MNYLIGINRSSIKTYIDGIWDDVKVSTNLKGYGRDVLFFTHDGLLIVAINPRIDKTWISSTFIIHRLINLKIVRGKFYYSDVIVIPFLDVISEKLKISPRLSFCVDCWGLDSGDIIDIETLINRKGY